MNWTRPSKTSLRLFRTNISFTCIRSNRRGDKVNWATTSQKERKRTITRSWRSPTRSSGLSPVKSLWAKNLCLPLQLFSLITIRIVNPAKILAKMDPRVVLPKRLRLEVITKTFLKKRWPMISAQRIHLWEILASLSPWEKLGLVSLIF